MPTTGKLGRSFAFAYFRLVAAPLQKLDHFQDSVLCDSLADESFPSGPSGLILSLSLAGFVLYKAAADA